MPALRVAAALAALFATAASASAAPYPDEAMVVREINMLRAQPAAYAAELHRLAAGYRGVYYREGDGIERASREGAAAVIEAADVLAHQPPLPPIIADPVLGAAARAHVAAQGPTGGIGHASSAGADPGERTRRQGGDIYVGEVITYGAHTPVDVVRSLVIDDGVAGRGHRRLLLSPAYHFAGVACGPHARWEMICVVDLAAAPGGRAQVPAR